MAGPELDTFQLFLNSLTVGVGDSCSLKFEGGSGGSGGGGGGGGGGGHPFRMGVVTVPPHGH